MITLRRPVRYPLGMTFEHALKQGDLDVARAILDELAELPDTGGPWMPECYANLAREYDRQGRHDDAISLHERAIELGWSTIPDAHSDIAEFHLRAGRDEQAAAIWAEQKAADPDDVWLYNAAGLSYNEVGQLELAIQWLAEGIELGMRTHDPEGIINQLSAVRRQSLDAIGRGLDDLEQRVDPFLEEWRSDERARRRRLARLTEFRFHDRAGMRTCPARRAARRGTGSPASGHGVGYGPVRKLEPSSSSWVWRARPRSRPGMRTAGQSAGDGRACVRVHLEPRTQRA